MKLFHKSLVLLMAMGLVIGLALHPGAVHAGDLTVDAKSTTPEVDKTIDYDDLTFSTDGGDGDPDGTLEAVGGRISDIQGFVDGEDSCSLNTSLLQDLMVRVLVWSSLF